MSGRASPRRGALTCLFERVDGGDDIENEEDGEGGADVEVQFLRTSEKAGIQVLKSIVSPALVDVAQGVFLSSWQLTDEHHARLCAMNGWPWFCSTRYNEPRNFAEQELSAPLHSAPHGRQSVLACVFDTWLKICG